MTKQANLEADRFRMTTGYEWAVETVDQWEDVIDVDHADTYAEAVAKAKLTEIPERGRIDIALCYLRGSEAEGLQDRKYAYVKDGALDPEYDEGGKVPARFIAEVASHV